MTALLHISFCTCRVVRRRELGFRDRSSFYRWTAASKVRLHDFFSSIFLPPSLSTFSLSSSVSFSQYLACRSHFDIVLLLDIATVASQGLCHYAGFVDAHWPPDRAAPCTAVWIQSFGSAFSRKSPQISLHFCPYACLYIPFCPAIYSFDVLYLILGPFSLMMWMSDE